MGTIESRQTERTRLLERRESAQSTPRSGGEALGNLGPTVTTVSAHSVSSRPSLEMPYLKVGSKRSIKLILPPQVTANEPLAKAFSDGIYYLFFHELGPTAIRWRELEKPGLENLYVDDGGHDRRKADSMIAFFNGFIKQLEICGITSQDFLSAVIKFKIDCIKRSEIPSLDEFFTNYLCPNANPDKGDARAITDHCNQLTPAFNGIFQWLSASKATCLLGSLTSFATHVGDMTPNLDAGDPELLKTAVERQATERGNFEAMVLFFVLRHQQSWLSKSPDLGHLEMAVNATVLLHAISRRIDNNNRVPMPPDPSDLIAALADRAMKAVAEEDLPDAERCADSLARLTEVSEAAAARLAEVKAVIAKYDAEADAVAAEVKIDI